VLEVNLQKINALKGAAAYIVFLSILVFTFIGTNISIGQISSRVVQLSGIVISEDDSTNALPGVHVYVPKYGRGTTTNAYGYFSMPALVGDSVVISAVGFRKMSYLVPGDEGDNITEIFELEVDTIYLENVDILPFPTEEAFKEAILALRLPDDTKKLRESLDGEYIAYMIMNTPYDGSLNARYFFDQQFYYQTHQYGNIANPFLNPLNWAKFIKSLKDGDFKKKKKKK